MVLVKNTDKNQGAKSYYRFVIVEKNGDDVRYMFTEPELAKAKYRADRNTSDWLPKKALTFLQRLLLK